MSRSISEEYRDPLELIWLEVAARLGWRIERSDSVYASWDGESVLTLSVSSDFDPDDHLAQLIFHEICHALVAGARGRKKLDWGMENYDDRDIVFEHACHRLQAHLAQQYGLRDFFAVTTDHRIYWDSLPKRTLAMGDDPAIELAQNGDIDARQEPWKGAIEYGLSKTAELARVLGSALPSQQLWSKIRPPHPSGFFEARASEVPKAAGCKNCAWSYTAPSNSPHLRCRRAESLGRKPRFPKESPPCEYWEKQLGEGSCFDCGACCHRAFHLVELRPSDIFIKKYPEWVARDHHGMHVPRPNGNCVALDGDGSSKSPYLCRVYEHRPKSCAEFGQASDGCLLARMRTGRSI